MPEKWVAAGMPFFLLPSSLPGSKLRGKGGSCPCVSLKASLLDSICAAPAPSGRRRGSPALSAPGPEPGRRHSAAMAVLRKVPWQYPSSTLAAYRAKVLRTYQGAHPDDMHVSVDSVARHLLGCHEQRPDVHIETQVGQPARWVQRGKNCVFGLFGCSVLYPSKVRHCLSKTA